MKNNLPSWDGTIESKEDPSPESRIIRMSRGNEFAEQTTNLAAMTVKLRLRVKMQVWCMVLSIARDTSGIWQACD